MAVGVPIRASRPSVATKKRRIPLSLEFRRLGALGQSTNHANINPQLFQLTGKRGDCMSAQPAQQAGSGPSGADAQIVGDHRKL